MRPFSAFLLHLVFRSILLPIKMILRLRSVWTTKINGCAIAIRASTGCKPSGSVDVEVPEMQAGMKKMS